MIQADYVCLYCDATFILVRRGTVSKEAVHTIVGIGSKGYKKCSIFKFILQSQRFIIVKIFKI
nr:hypothetical protein [Facklamia hominis]